MKLLRTLCLASLLLATTASVSAVVTVDRVVAVVNRTAITRLELDERIASIRQNLTSQGMQAPAAETLETEALQRMVTERILQEQASQLGLRVDDSQLERTLVGMAQRNNMSLPEFRKRLEADGMNWRQFSEEIRQEITVSTLRDREIESRIMVSDNEIDTYLKQNANKASMEYRIAQIMIALPENATPEQIQFRRARMLNAKKEIEDGKDFGVVAATYSNAADAANGGLIGWRSSGSLPPALVELLEQLKPGQNTDVIRSGTGLHMFKLLDRREQSEKIVVRQTSARHILIKTNELVSEMEARQKLLQVRERLQNGEKFEELARIFSEDGSAAKGGDLGWISPGDTVPDFEKAMDKLNPGDLSQPVQSPFGLHLIKVIERRDQDITVDANRNKARQDLRKRKADEMYDDWIRQLRDKAYISIRLKDE